MQEGKVKVYVAGPVTGSGDRIQNLCRALTAAKMLLDEGFCPVVPHLCIAWELFAQGKIPESTWIEYTMELLRGCDVIVVLPGESPGAERELAWAKSHNLVWFEWKDLGAASGDWLTPVRACIAAKRAGRLEKRESTIPPAPPIIDSDKLTLDALQDQVAKWTAKQPFGKDQDPIEPLMGMVEEIGELNRAHLKERQAIRGTAEEQQQAAKDAIGDIMVFMAGYCNSRGWSMRECLEMAWREVQTRDWTKHQKTGHAEPEEVPTWQEQIQEQLDATRKEN